MNSFKYTIRNFITTTLKRNLIVAVDDFHHRRISDDQDHSVYVFPRLPGQVTEYHNPALEFIKCISIVLSQDLQLEEEARSLNRNLLRLIGVTEFSNSAIFQPTERFVLTQVICEYCNYSCDLDLTKSSEFLCSGCSNPYSIEELELMLISKLNELIAKWQLQDLKCTRCKLVTAEDLHPFCKKCNGNLKTVLSQEEYTKTVLIMSRIANSYRLENLKEACAFVVKT
jgi:DNA polymerase epsilon subunit 1